MNPWKKWKWKFGNSSCLGCCRRKVLDLGERTLIMGIVNTTPDSFSDGGQHSTTEVRMVCFEKREVTSY